MHVFCNWKDKSQRYTLLELSAHAYFASTDRTGTKMVLSIRQMLTSSPALRHISEPRAKYSR